MKKILVTLSMALLFALSCSDGKSNAVENMAHRINVKGKSKPSDSTFRRFTFSLLSNNPETSKILSDVNWVILNQTGAKLGIHAVKCYKRDGVYFFVLDADKTFNSKTLMEKFAQMENIKPAINKLKAIGIIFPRGKGALKRIYKLDQKVVYNVDEGQLETEIGPHKRFVWTLLLNPDAKLMAEYKKAHSMGHAWPQITKI